MATTEIPNGDLTQFESQLDQLLLKHDRLVHENHSLRQQLAKVTQERALLAEQQKRTTARLKAVLNQLKEEVAS